MEDERIETRLAALPARDLDPQRADALGRRLRGTFLRAHDEARHPWLAAWGRLWASWLEPALTTGAVGVYLIWAIGAAATLLGAA